MKPRYLFRLDDVTPAVDPNLFDACLRIFHEAGIRPILGVVPENRDPLLNNSRAAPEFWDRIGRLSMEKKVTIAQHGLHHVYHRHSGALLRRYGVDDHSEFTGLSFDVQFDKIQRGKELMAAHELVPAVWMSPNHSFDMGTIKALRKAGFAFVTDGIGFYPYKKLGLTFLPVLSGKPRRTLFGLTTICLHPNTMTENDFARLRSFLNAAPQVVSFEEAIEMHRPWFAPIANGLCRMAFLLIKTIMRLKRSFRPQTASSAMKTLR